MRRHEDTTHEQDELILDGLGSHGWELIAVRRNDSSGAKFFYMKRPRTRDADSMEANAT